MDAADAQLCGALLIDAMPELEEQWGMPLVEPCMADQGKSRQHCWGTLARASRAAQDARC